MRSIIFVAIVLSVVGPNLRCAASDVQRGISHIVLDDVRIDYDSEVEVVGEVVSPIRHNRKDDHGPALRVARVNQRPTLKHLQMFLRTPQDQDHSAFERLERLEHGHWFRMWGRWVDGRHRGNIVDGVLVVQRFERIDPEPVRLKEVSGREEIVEGLAIRDRQLQFGDETVRVNGPTQWPEHAIGKRVAVSGQVRSAKDEISIDDTQWRLIDLRDQVGQRITLSGQMDPYGRLGVDDRRIILRDKQGNESQPSYDQIRATGVLTSEQRPVVGLFGPLEGSEQRMEAALVLCEATTERIPPNPRDWDLQQRLFDTAIRSQQGVYLLTPEGAHAGQFNAPQTQWCYFRNRTAIEANLAQPTEAMRNIFVEHMTAESEKWHVRLLYASMLARLNDTRGRDFLLKHIRKSNGQIDVETVHCFGLFAEIAPEQKTVSVDLKWALLHMIELMRDDRPVEPQDSLPFPAYYGDELAPLKQNKATSPITVSEAVVVFSSIENVLIRSCEPNARKVVIDYALAGRRGAGRIVESPLLKEFSRDELVQLLNVAKQSRLRRYVEDELALRK